MADVKAIITEAAQRYGMDPDAALRIATIESTLNPSAQNPASSAGGLFQFIDETWAKYGNGHSKFDPYANADAGMRLMRDNARYLKSKLGRDPTPGELYLAHQQGLGGAELILRNPGANAAELLGTRKVTLNGGNTSMTAAEFASLWTKRMGDVQVPREALVSGMSPPGSMEASSNPGEFNVNQPGRVSYTDIMTPQAESDREIAAREQAMEDNAPGLIEGIGLAVKNEWSILTPFRMLSGQEPDPNFRLTEDKLKAIAKDIPDAYLDDFADAVSDDHAMAIRERILRQMEVNQKLASMGATGVVLQMGAAMTDPGAWAATAAISFATGGLGAPAAVGARFGRVGMVGLAAAEGIAGNLATDVPLIAVDPTRSVDDLKYSIGTGLVMGGIMGAVAKNPVLASEGVAIAKLGKEMQDNAFVRGVDGSSSTGAASVLAPNTLRGDAEDLSREFSKLAPKEVSGYKKAIQAVRFDVVGSMLKSKNPMMKVLGPLLGEDAVRSLDGGVTHIAATERMSKRFAASSYRYLSGFDDAWKKYRKANKIGFWQAAGEQNKFKVQVTDYIRERNPEARASFPAEVREAGSAFEREMRAFWKEARELGLTRSEEGVEAYFPRYADLSAASEKISKYGYSRDQRRGGLASLFREAILERQKDIDPDLAHKLGYAIVERFHKLKAGENLMHLNHGSIDMEDLDGFLKDFLDDNDIANLKAYLMRNEAKEGAGSARLKHRIDFDENFVGGVHNRETGATDRVSIKDFYINDPNVAFQMYSRQMSGQLALAETVVRDADGRVIVEGIKNSSDWQKLKEQVMAVGDLHGANTKEDLDNLDFMYSAITGSPYKGQDKGSDFDLFLRMLRDYNFVRLMGQVGFSQIQEFGRMSSQIGLKTLYQAMPSFREIRQMITNGKVSDELADELIAMGAPGTEGFRGKFHLTADDFGNPEALGGDTMMQKVYAKVAPVQQKMNHFVATYSGMHPINTVFQQWSARAMAVKFVRMSMFGDKINVERMRALGLSDEMFGKIMENIKTHATFRDGVRQPTKLEKLNLDKWDGQSAAAFENAIYRAHRNIIMANDPGQFMKWMNHPLGKTFLQFRSFAVGSWSKALLQGLNLKDAEAGLGFLSSMFLGGLVYYGQTHLNLIGDPQRDKKIKDRLSWQKVGLASFQRTSESSLLPIPIDMLSDLIRGEPLFDARSSGLQTTADTMFGNPTQDLISTTFKGVRGVTTALFNGDDYSNPDFKNLTRALPFQRMMGFVQFFNWISSGLPQREMRD